MTPELKAAEVIAVLEEHARLSKAVLSGHGSQFKEQWKKGCCKRCVEVYFTRPSCPQDKGKVEQRIQNLKLEFADHLRQFSELLKR